MREVPQRLASPSEETPKKKKKKNQISVSNSIKAGHQQLFVMVGRYHESGGTIIPPADHGYLELRMGITVSRAYDIKRMNTFL